jgi:hypothetical protein
VTVLATRPELLAETYDPHVGPGADAMAASTKVGTGGVKRHLTATSLAQFKTMFANLQPGDWLEAKGVRFTGQVVLRKSLSGWAKVTLDSDCTVTGVTSQSNVPAFYVPGANNLIVLVHCDVTNKLGGSALLVYRCNRFVFDVVEPAAVHDCGTNAFSLLPARMATQGDIQNFYVRALAHNVDQHLAYDPHAEKGTGIHGAITSDAAGGVMHHGAIVLHTHTTGAGNKTGGGSNVEIGIPGSLASLKAHDILILSQSEDMMFMAKTQTAGNGVNNWGYIGANVVERIWHQDSAGYASKVDGQGGTSKAGVSVVAGAAKNVCQNPHYRGQNPWQKGSGIQYAGTLTPAP